MKKLCFFLLVQRYEEIPTTEKTFCKRPVFLSEMVTNTHFMRLFNDKLLILT